MPAVGELLPSAAAVALSPFPIIAVVVVLSAPRARANGVAFAVGWLIGLSALSIVVVAVVGTAAGDRDSSPALAWARILVGLALFALAARRWRTRPAEDEEPTVPGWMASLDELSPRKAVGIGMALAGANPKNVALTLAAVGAVGDVGSSDGGRAVAIAAYVLVGSASVLGAVGAHLVAGERAAAPLAAVKAFMVRNHTVIIVAVLVLLGVMVGSEGLSALRD